MAEIAEKIGNAGERKFDATDKTGLARQLAEIDELRNPAREIAPLAKRIDELSRVHADFATRIFPWLKSSHSSPPSSRRFAGSVGSIDERRRSLIELLKAIEFASLAPDVVALALGDPIEELDKKLQIEFDTDFRRLMSITAI
jgi:hypothetical protein